MLRPEKHLRPSGTCTTPAPTILLGLRGRGAPSNSTVPVLGFTKPEIVRSSVVLPAPLAPMMETICPLCTSTLMPRSAST